MLQDEAIRQRALVPDQSFIVQAPAGSGKTSLLTQRFLHLLAHAVYQPEEIIAITFTRKAAAEMRQRVMTALQNAESPIAQKVRQRDQQQHWQLLENPYRLRIMTIDALCLQLVQQLPLRAKCHPQLRLIEQPDALYRAAIQEILMDLPSSEVKKAFHDLLHHLDNQLENLINLLVAVLAKRDQWLPHIFDWHAVEYLETTLKNVYAELWQQCDALIPATLQSLYQSLKKQFGSSLPDILLTKEGTWRKRFTKMPKEELAVCKEFIETAITIPELQETFRELQYAPSTEYSETQRKILRALATLLPITVAQLQLIFAQESSYDFMEIALRALQALGTEEAPTDTALQWDYQIRHLLVDEFQDTSVIQLRLLEKLTAGWMPNDGRTIFLVGDPMQSIYRFRKAEVGLFLSAQQYGLGNIALESLTLTTNFRATRTLVAWFNQSFNQIFPSQPNIALGAIPYTLATPAPDASEGQPIEYHVVENTPEAEAQKIVELLQNTWQQHPQAKVAILVRARQHLHAILPALLQANIPYRATEIAHIADYPCIQDLVALTRALLHPADRVAWLAILRAPWCGLTLEELHALAANPQQTVWQALQLHCASVTTIDISPRVSHIFDAFSWAWQMRGRLKLSAWVRETWQRLHGDKCLSKNYERELVQRYFHLLESLSLDIDAEILETRIAALLFSQDTPEARLEIMTIHKSKGLEFDVVILAGLDKSTRADSASLFLWHERINPHGQAELMVAPIKSSQQHDDTIYVYLQREEGKRAKLELQRLGYVAATRAKKNLHFLLPTGINKPRENSLLSIWWPLVKNRIADLPTPKIIEPLVAEENKITVLPLKRLATPLLNREFTPHKEVAKNPKLAEFSTLDSLLSRVTGTVIHEQLQYWRQENFAPFDWLYDPQTIKYWQLRLLQLGCPSSQLENAIVKIQQCLKNICVDPQAHWIFSAKHRQICTEYALTLPIEEGVKTIIIDRTFIDAEDRRWIIDYKITAEATREPYIAQLQQYAVALQQRETRSIWLGLYFPLSAQWIAWAYENSMA